MIFRAGNLLKASAEDWRDSNVDYLTRSTGYGSLEIWIRNLRQGIIFQQTFAASDGCTKSDWTGSSITIAGGYVWQDVYAEANKRNVVVVGGGDPVRVSQDVQKLISAPKLINTVERWLYRRVGSRWRSFSCFPRLRFGSRSDFRSESGSC